MVSSRPRAVLTAALLVAVFSCSDEVLTTPQAPSDPSGPSSRDGGSSDDGGLRGDAALPDGDSGAVPPHGNLRLLAGNLSSGNNSSYDPGDGIRIIQAMKPDVALLQEVNFKSGSSADIAELVSTAFGADYTVTREQGVQIPNAIVSRYPITTSGNWVDPFVSNRSFVYAKIAVPGSHALWAVSVHLLTTSSANRSNEATALVAELKKVVAPDDFIVVGGDFNTDSRTETCLTKLGELLDTKAPYPADQSGDSDTNSSRAKPYDWVLTSAPLRAFEVPTVVGSVSAAAGLVFDTRVFTPLADAPPAKATDSSATNMQHMAVVRDFKL